MTLRPSYSSCRGGHRGAGELQPVRARGDPGRSHSCRWPRFGRGRCCYHASLLPHLQCMIKLWRQQITAQTDRPTPARPGSLDETLLSRPCPRRDCDRTVVCRARDVLQQPDCGGYDPDGSEPKPRATVRCAGGHGVFVTNLCKGKPKFTRGERHNHCEICPAFGPGSG